MHKQKWYADLTQNQLGIWIIWYMIWKFISKKTLGREAIKIMTLVNTPKGEQNSLASCSPFTDLIKPINIYNHIHIDELRYVSCVVYSTVLQGKFRAIVEAFSVKASVLLVPDSSWEVIAIQSQPADKQMYLQQGVEGYFEARDV